jgi:hypothetical protein
MTAAFIVPASPSSLFDHQVVIIGETHRRADSTEWFLTTVSNYVKNGKCLHVALEIKSSQQPVLNAAMRGNAPFSSIRIHPIIDHPSYRDMLKGFGGLIMKKHCLTVHAIDAPKNVRVNRDKWMAEHFPDIRNGTPIIALLGSLHALKQVNWYQGVKDEPYLAERLQAAGIDVFSVIQNWPSGNCETRKVNFVTADTKEGTRALGHVLDPVAADFPDDPYSAIDAALVWKCQQEE